jgi:hypothetical protein
VTVSVTDLLTRSSLEDRSRHRTRPGWSDGFSLPAAVVIADTDRAGLERLCAPPWRGERLAGAGLVPAPRSRRPAMTGDAAVGAGSGLAGQRVTHREPIVPHTLGDDLA